MTTTEILTRLTNVRKSVSGWSARCPAHRDRYNSLSIGRGREGRILLHCFAGCEFNEIVAALGLRRYQLWPDRGAMRSVRLQLRRPSKSTTISDFESWRNGHIRHLNTRYRTLARSAQHASEVLREDPGNEGALEIVAKFAHSEAELCRALDFLLCTKGSEWLERDSTPVEVFERWRIGRNHA